jgi:methanogenic corrinoid protein MtbC1
VDHVLESEVIPRLLVSHSGLPQALPPGSGSVDDIEVAAFAPLAVTLEAHELLAEVEAFARRGLSVERIFIEVLAPAARWLGDEWAEDRIDFLDVTMGLWRLQEVLREIAARYPASGMEGGTSRSALFAPFPGDQHSFGASMIDECFARAGWSTELLLTPSRATLLARVSAQHFDLIGLTVSNDSHIAPLPSLVTAVRNVSRNPNICLMLGGRVLTENPDLAIRVGADATAATATDALATADRLLATPLHVATA